jgi:hypothetical protein
MDIDISARTGARISDTAVDSNRDMCLLSDPQIELPMLQFISNSSHEKKQ